MTTEPSADSGNPGPRWRVARASGGGNCVQVAKLGASVAVRDSKSLDRPYQLYGDAAWRRLLERIKSGELSG